jgi:hypothetical protein
LALAVPVDTSSASGALEGKSSAWEAPEGTSSASADRSPADRSPAEDKSLAEAWKDRSSAEGAAVGKWSAGTSGG